MERRLAQKSTQKRVFHFATVCAVSNDLHANCGIDWETFRSFMLTSVTSSMKFSREFNFTDFRFFAFRDNKFSQIWISDFTARNPFPWISGKSLSCISRAVFVYNGIARGCNVLFFRFYSNLLGDRKLFCCSYKDFQANVGHHYLVNLIENLNIWSKLSRTFFFRRSLFLRNLIFTDRGNTHKIRENQIQRKFCATR